MMSGYLLDTNALSEAVKPKRNEAVVAWIQALPVEATFVSALSLGEVRKGLHRLAASRRREELRMWLETVLIDWFDERILAVDWKVADRWGRLVADQSATPRPIIDSLIAATGLAHGLTLVTRDADLVGIPGLEVINPWTMN
jgi:toxin FitB